MANPFGYNHLFTDRPETWLADGYVQITDGSGTPSFATVPSGVVNSVVHNSLGNYSIILQEPWFALLYASVHTEIPANLSPATLGVQLVKDTVGQASVLPKSAGGPGQSVTFQVNNAGTPTDPPQGSGLRFLLILKRSSA